jgi:glycerol kinase
MAAQFILALDQGTTSSRAILFDVNGHPVASEQEAFPQIYPQPGWVEHDAEAIWATQLGTAQRLLAKQQVAPEAIAAIGITNQRETTVVWERATGRPIYNAIVWQCRRTTELCERLKADGLEEEIRRRTGLVLDAYFSGTKVRWILDHVPGAQERAERGELCFGTIDSWLLFKLTGTHATDYSNAARTLLFNIHELRWDPLILETLKIPAAMLPEVHPTSHVFGSTTVLGGEIPVAAMVGDQQAALFGQAAFDPGNCKNTYGTGAFIVINTGRWPVDSKRGLLTTIAWGLDGQVTYALEGSVFIAGAVIQWLRDEVQLIATAAESEALAQSVADTQGVYLVPAFVGLGAPHWDMRARGIITGLTRGAGRAHIVRAALESIAYQTADVVQTMRSDTNAQIDGLRVDGGASANNFLMQHQADALGVPVLRGQTLETTALGAASLAGLAVGFWSGLDALRAVWQLDRRFEPTWDNAQRAKALAGWDEAVRRARFDAS